MALHILAVTDIWPPDFTERRNKYLPYRHSMRLNLENVWSVGFQVLTAVIMMSYIFLGYNTEVKVLS
jgi:hypothetical protein